HYRTGALADNASRPLKFAGQGACVECHTDVAEVRAQGRHAHVACESCHGALAAHAGNQSSGKPARPDPRKTCIVCHTASISKPKTFPQVVVADHAPEGSCAECHQVHNPKLS
ncbi:MAG: multiheme c-type cytochrome, partial [Acidobacteria bacterium]|nr:multiheme c-type cytochrome [Acidobacteriota bacterium]